MLDKIITQLTSLLVSHDLNTICRRDIKFKPDVTTQVLQVPGPSDSVRCICIIKELHRWYHQPGHVTLVQSTDMIKNKDQIAFLKLYKWGAPKLCQMCIQKKKNYLVEFTTIVTQHRYNLQTSEKIRSHCYNFKLVL